MKTFGLYTILSAQKGTIQIVSSDPEKIVLPYHQIQHTKFLKQESRYIVRNFFQEFNTLFSENFRYNFMDVQDIDSIDYLQEITDYNPDEDISILYGGFSELLLLKENLYWLPINFNIESSTYCENKYLNSIIDNVINKAHV